MYANRPRSCRRNDLDVCPVCESTCMRNDRLPNDVNPNRRLCTLQTTQTLQTGYFVFFTFFYDEILNSRNTIVKKQERLLLLLLWSTTSHNCKAFSIIWGPFCLNFSACESLPFISSWFPVRNKSPKNRMLSQAIILADCYNLIEEHGETIASLPFDFNMEYFLSFFYKILTLLVTRIHLFMYSFSLLPPQLLVRDQKNIFSLLPQLP